MSAILKKKHSFDLLWINCDYFNRLLVVSEERLVNTSRPISPLFGLKVYHLIFHHVVLLVSSVYQRTVSYLKLDTYTLYLFLMSSEGSLHFKNGEITVFFSNLVKSVQAVWIHKILRPVRIIKGKHCYRARVSHD